MEIKSSHIQKITIAKHAFHFISDIFCQLNLDSAVVSNLFQLADFTTAFRRDTKIAFRKILFSDGIKAIPWRRSWANLHQKLNSSECQSNSTELLKLSLTTLIRKSLKKDQEVGRMKQAHFHRYSTESAEFTSFPE